MQMTECLREYEVMETVGCGRWPDQCPDELRTHVASCPLCTDVLAVALALHTDRDAAQLDARIPSAGLVWWRAELRARQEAMRTVSRPITFVQTFGAAAVVGVAIALLSRAWPWLKSLFVLPDFSTLSFTQWGIVIGLALAFLVVAPLTMYLVLSDE